MSHPFLPYKPHCRGRRRPRVDWVLVALAIPCGLWVLVSFALPLTQSEHEFGTITDDGAFIVFAFATVCSLPAVVGFLLAVWIKKRGR